MPKTWIATEVESPIKDAHFVGEEKIRIISKVLYTGENVFQEIHAKLRSGFYKIECYINKSFDEPYF